MVAATAGKASGAAVATVMQSAGSVVVSPPADTVALGETLRLVAEAFDENGHRVEGAEFRWSSSDVSVATVDGAGLVAGVAEGAATITAAAGDASGASEITVENPDRAGLVALYNATDGPNWVNNHGWLTDAPLGEWDRVGTDASGRVVRLDLSYNGLKGVTPSELGSLSNLEVSRPVQKPTHRSDPIRTGQPLQPDQPDPRQERPDGPDSRRTGQPLQPGVSRPVQKPTHRPDPARTGVTSPTWSFSTCPKTNSPARSRPN